MIGLSYATLARTLAVLVAVAAPGVPTQEASPEMQARILLQALSFDRNLAQRKADGYVIFVIHAPVGAARPASDLARAFESEAEQRHPRLGLQVVTHPWGRIEPLRKRLQRLGADAIYLHRSAARWVPELLPLARSLRIPTVGGTGELADQGLSLGVVGVDEPLLGVNQAAAELEALDLPSSLLKVAQIRGE